MQECVYLCVWVCVFLLSGDRFEWGMGRRRAQRRNVDRRCVDGKNKCNFSVKRV